VSKCHCLSQKPLLTTGVLNPGPLSKGHKSLRYSIWARQLVRVWNFIIIARANRLPMLDGPAVIALWRAIAEVKQCWSVMRWVTKNLLSRAPPCFGRHVKPLILAAFAIANTHQSALGPRGYGPFFLCVIHKEGLCLCSGDINRLMMK
jgi:hypothetical protein